MNFNLDSTDFYKYGVFLRTKNIIYTHTHARARAAVYEPLIKNCGLKLQIIHGGVGWGGRYVTISMKTNPVHWCKHSATAFGRNALRI